MVLVFFRGYGDWFIEDSNGEISHAISADKRMTYIESGICTGWLRYRPSDEVSGIFRLTDKDEETYLYTEDTSKVEKLLPCSHPDSAFSRMVDRCLLANENIERCHFLIVESYRRGRKTIDLPHVLKVHKTNNIANTETTPKAGTITKKHDYSKLLMMIFGMAIDKYGHNPKNPKDTTYNEIGKRLKLQGIPVDKESIAMCLIEGDRLYDIGAGTKVVKDVKIVIEQSDLIIIIYGMAVDGYGYSKEKTTRSLVTGSDKNASISGRFANPNVIIHRNLKRKSTGFFKV